MPVPVDTTPDILGIRDEDNEIFTEATVTSPPLTTVINGFILPQTVRNFFKRPTFNPVDSNGIETVRTSEKKQLEKATTKRANADLDRTTELVGGTTETYTEETTTYFNSNPTTQPMGLFSDEDVSESNQLDFDETTSKSGKEHTTIVYSNEINKKLNDQYSPST